jgi:urease subunit alpha
MFGAFGSAAAKTSMTFLSQAAIDKNVPEIVGMTRLVGVCKNTRNIGKDDMIHNNWQPEIEVDSQTYEVRANGELLTCEPATELPLAQRYTLF